MRKTLCALWVLDDTSVARMQTLSSALAGSPFLCTGFFPHITLGCYENILVRELRPWVRAYAQSIAPFDIHFEKAGLLTPERPACFPAFEGGLLTHYQAFHQRLDEYADSWTGLRGGLYVPHVSLYDGKGAGEEAAQTRLKAAFEPFDGRAVALALSLVKGEEDYEVLIVYPLGNRGIMRTT